jgi:cell division protein FtsB
MSQQINLFNPVFLKQKKQFTALRMAQALGLVLIGGVLLSAYAAYQSRELSQQAADVGAQLATAQQELAQTNARLVPRKKNQALEDELTRLQTEQDSLQQAMVKLQNDEFGNRVGYSAYLRAFARQITPNLWLTGFSIDGAGRAIGIQGRTLQPELVPAYIKRLSQEPVLQGISFAVLEMQAQQKDTSKETEGKAGPDASRKREVPDYIDFDLRSSGVEKAATKQASGYGGAKAQADAPVQSTKAPADAGAQAARNQIDAAMQAAKAVAPPAADSNGKVK